MKTSFYHFRHPVVGELKLEADDQHVYFSCHWPFDLATDDWDECTLISNTFSLKDYVSKIHSLAKGRAVAINGELPGSLNLEVLDAKHIKLVAVESLPKSNHEFPITIQASPAELLPKSEVAGEASKGAAQKTKNRRLIARNSAN